jgi:nitrogen fixation protein
MRGWRFVYLPDLVAPAELPVEMNAFKTQQQRWAKGSVQVCKKLLPRVLASELPWREKVEATFHLTANLAYPLMVLLACLMFPAMLLRYNMGWAEMIVVDVPIFLAATASVCTFYALSQKEQFARGWKLKLRYIPAVLGIGIGISINNALAVIEGLFGKPSEFARTPKYGIEGASDTWKQKAYKGKSNWVPYAELALAGYFTFTSIYALAHGLVGTLPFIAIFQWGFLYTSGMSLAQSYDWLVPRQQEA